MALLLVGTDSLEESSMKDAKSGAMTRKTSMAPEMQTPPTLFESLWGEFSGFDLDPCCQVGDPTAEKVLSEGGMIYVAPEEGYRLDKIAQDSGVGLRRAAQIRVDGLTQPWFGKVFMNPPYDRTLGLWVQRAANEVWTGRADKVVALLPSNTGSPWWQEYVAQSFHVNSGVERGSLALEQVRFLRSRLRFHWKGEPMKFTARFASVVVVWSRLKRAPKGSRSQTGNAK